MRGQLFGCMFTVLVVSVHGFSLPSLNGTLKTISDVVESKVDSTIAIAQKVPDLIPSPNTILAMGKETFAGLPFQVAMTALNKLCTIAISGNSTRGKYTPDIIKIGLFLIKDGSSVTHPLTSPEELWNDPLFDKDNKLIVYVTGWLTGLTNGTEIEGSMKELSTAYSVRGGYNFVILDSAKYMSTMYSWAAFNTEKIGQLLAESLVKLVEVYPLENIHLIGHSLGAQIAGATGRHFHKITEKLLPRITGLDPANPCFSEGEALSGLFRGDADFIDIIHTNNGVLGVENSIGDIDFYPNGFNALQAGCFTIICAHQRAWEYYAETVYPGNEGNFLATRCNSLTALRAGMCRGKRIHMGFGSPTNLTGNYFLKTRSSHPFGKHFKNTAFTRNKKRNKCWRH